MELEKFGEEVIIELAKDTNYDPLTINVSSPARLVYSGKLETWEVLQAQLLVVQRRMASFIAQQLGSWASGRAKAGRITSKKACNGQVNVDTFGSSTSIRATCYAGGKMAVEIWLPTGIIVEPSNQIAALNAEFNTLRSRLVNEFKTACDDYANNVDIAANELTLSELGLDAEMTIN